MQARSRLGAMVLSCGLFALAVSSPAKAAQPVRVAEAQRPADPASDPAATLLAEKVQAFYEKTQDLTADVEQAYTYHAMHRTLKASGTMQLRKPGMLRWDVVKPYPKQYVIDGKALYVFDSEDNEVVVKKEFAADTLSAAITFLWGKGKLTREFDVAMADKPEYGATVLVLTPKGKGSGFSRIYFAVEPSSGLVRTSVVIDSEGNENRLAFAHVKTNAGLDAARFQFQIPAGATVTER